MAFCGKCGNKLQDNDNFCRNCGASVAAKSTGDTAREAASKAAEAARETASKFADATRETASKVADAARETASKVAEAARETASNASNAARQAWQGEEGASDADISKNKGLAILSYIPLVNLIPYFVEKESRYVRFHAVQGMYLLILEIILSIGANIFRSMRWGMYGFWWVMGGGWMFFLLEFACGALVIALCIVGIVNASSGKMKPLPIVNQMTRWGWFK